MLDFRLLGSTPYGNRTALYDLAGTLQLFHKALAPAVFAQTGNTYRTFDIGTPGGPEWLQAIQQLYQNANAALGLPPPVDLESYDLDEPADWSSWTFILSQATRTLQIAAGL